MALVFFRSNHQPDTVEFTVYEYPTVQSKGITKPLDLKQPKSQPIKEEKTSGRSVFGLNKDSLVEESSGKENAASVTVKKGNTLAIPQDDKTLTDEDAQALPLPTDDYLVTKMASIVKSFRIPYPEEARKNSVEGPVIIDLLIDKNGKVREANVISGPGSGLNEAAANAVAKFEFNPAYVKDKPVAVRVRYTYRFVLE